MTQEGVCIAAGQAAGGSQVGAHPHILLPCIPSAMLSLSNAGQSHTEMQEDCMEPCCVEDSFHTGKGDIDRRCI